MSRIGYLKHWFIYRFLTNNHIVAFPKSGTTWVRYFLSTYTSAYYQKEIAPDNDRQIERVVTEFPRYYFSHIGGVPGHQAAVMSEGTHAKILKKVFRELKEKNVIFLARDPRDVVVSYYFHLKKHKDDDTTLSEFIRDTKSGLPAIISYMNAWVERKDAFKTFHIYSYEKRVEHPKEEFSRMLQQLGIPIDESVLERAIAESSFDSMKKIQHEKKSDYKIFTGEKEGDPESGQMRKGKIGGYHDYFTVEDEKYAREILKTLDPAFGYSLK